MMKNCRKLPKLLLLQCRKAHSFQAIKDIDLKFLINGGVWFLRNGGERFLTNGGVHYLSDLEAYSSNGTENHLNIVFLFFQGGRKSISWDQKVFSQSFFSKSK